MRVAAAWFVVVAGWVGGTIIRATPQQAIFRADAAAVTIDVSVRRRNAPVGGLTANNFELLDNGVRQQIALVGIEEMPLDVTLAFDVGWFASMSFGNRSESVLANVAALLRPIDRVRVITFATDVREVFPMQGPETLSRGLLKMAPLDLHRAGRPSQAQLDVQRDPNLLESFSDAILFGLARPPEAGRRHLVFAYGAGTDTGSILRYNEALVPVASRSDALLQIAWRVSWKSVTLPEGINPGSHLTYIRRVMDAAAAATGGSVWDVDDAVGGVKSILADFRSRYLLQYVPTGVARGGWHDVTVTTPKFPDYKIQARKGYLGR